MGVECELCGRGLNLATMRTYQYVEGWAKMRTAGGSNAISQPVRHHRFACGECMDRLARGASPDQTSMF